MKTILTIILIGWSLCLLGQSQEGMDKIESARIALITQRLELTPDQAERFWPLYREYTQQRQDLRQEFVNARNNLDKKELSEEQTKQLLDQGLKLKERELDLDKRYLERLNKVITNRQLLELRKAEQDFRRMLLERLQNRAEKRENFQRRQQLRDNN